MSDTLIEYAIDGSQPRMRTSEQELRTSERAHNEALAQLTARREGGEERRSVAARPPKVKSRGGTGRKTEGNRLQLFNENTRLRVNRELGGWIPTWPFGLPFGLSLWSLG